VKPGERPLTVDDDLFPGGAEMAALMRVHDWASTSIGSSDGWSPALRTMVRILLVNRFPMLLWWGPDYISIYNDAYSPILGRKHPAALGLPVRECWSEIWDILKPLIDTPFHGGPATWIEDIELQINRAGFIEETHFTVAYSPVPDEQARSGIGGVLATVHEITEKVVGNRRSDILRDLGTRAAEAKIAEEACAAAAAILGNHSKDIAFALFYLLDPDGRHARLASSCGVETAAAVAPAVVELKDSTPIASWPLAAAQRAESMLLVENLSSIFTAVPAGPWPEPPHTAVILPIRSNLAHQLSGFLVAGLSSHLLFDGLYRNFLNLAAVQIATAISNARAYEEERRRAEALADIDRAKTAFFSNVSHEFRTPLTLMLGPLESLLGQDHVLPAEDRTQIETAHRNSLRLLKLVNSLLDFSRIEAGRAQAVYEPLDLATLTSEIASNFRSAFERAGLALIVNCPVLAEPIYVDREMWEKITLNLLSNAFKFTFEGSIAVTLRACPGGAELSVADTGVGIPSHELPHLFERFHRVEGARGRTFEGSGIGLALVHELVKLHGGSIHVESEIDRGATFRIFIPEGTAHLPVDRTSASPRPSATTLHSESFVEEALRWLPLSSPGTEREAPRVKGPSGRFPRLVIAEDNSDMRGYIKSLLVSQYDVIAASNGEEALRAIREFSPDLVLTDVMMPQMDGFELLRELRGDPATRAIPVILLSARAGEEASIEGLETGADDYLTKPFTARELLARINSHVEMARVRREALEAVRRSEAELRQNQAKLEALIVELERSNDELSQFSYLVAHDLESPVRTIRSFVELLIQKHSGDGDDEICLTITAAAERMQLLIRSLLEYAEVGHGELRQVEVPLGEAVRSVVETLGVLIAETGAEIRYNDLPVVDADRLQIEQLFQNLISNAIKYRCKDTIPVITITAERIPESWQLAVKDNGQGIPSKYARSVFEPLKRLHGHEIPGTGLGLAMCATIVERHGGRIWLESPGADCGTTFYFTLAAEESKDLPARRAREGG
jgi:signal transduction histidine kinase